jgi:hypothetical protein
VLKRDITYENFDGEEVTETFYFNLTKTELLEMQIEYHGGMEELITRIIKEEAVKEIFELFKKIVLASYGIRSEDGKRFIKSNQIREEFQQTAAYDALIVELATNDQSASDFIIAVVPRAMAEEIQKQGSIDVPLPLENVPPPSTT